MKKEGFHLSSLTAMEAFFETCSGQVVHYGNLYLFAAGISVADIFLHRHEYYTVHLLHTVCGKEAQPLVDFNRIG